MRACTRVYKGVEDIVTSVDIYIYAHRVRANENSEVFIY